MRITLALLSSAASAMAMPAGQPSHLAPRDSVNMRLCVTAFYQQCTLFNFVALGVCQNVPTNLNDKISSIDHSQHHSCRFWKNAGCTGDFIGGNEDFYSNLQDQGFNDVISSWRCS
ncbi:hypothetical protein MN608_10181 [Microdochium nivale]|nr:hypothetical protein MN608_10181 [Microdochium nivale]